MGSRARARNGNPLLLAPRQQDPLLADLGIVPLGQGDDEFVDEGIATDLVQPFCGERAGIGDAEKDVIAYGPAEHGRFLGYQRQGLSILIDVEVFHVGPIA